MQKKEVFFLKPEVITGIFGLAFIVICGLLVFLSPDFMSLMFVIGMCILMTLGFVFGFLSVNTYRKALRYGRDEVEKANKVDSDKAWDYLKGKNVIFNNHELDNNFVEYKENILNESQNEFSTSADMDDLINDGLIASKTWKNLIGQIPGSLTGLGLLGTFIGLIIGISGIGFTSVSVAINSIEALITGIGTAFYTSIAGIIMSLAFNLAYRVMWNLLLRDLEAFTYDFHKKIVPTQNNRQEMNQNKFYKLMLENLNDIKLILEGNR